MASDRRHSQLASSTRENPKVVSERLGHTKVAFTLDRYGHVLPGMQEKAAAKLEAILFGE
jgi:integrase